jgi:hypothetical protein
LPYRCKPNHTQIAELNQITEVPTDLLRMPVTVMPNGGGWVDLGFTGNAFSDSTYSVTQTHDGYLIVRSNATLVVT